MRTLRIAFDATPLLGLRTGVGAFTAGAIDALAARGDVEIRAYALTWRGRGTLGEAIPAGVDVVTRPMPARPLRWCWSRADRPRVERWTGPVDVVHGTNFVVPPARAGQVVTVHDLTSVRFPELCDRQTLAFPHLVRRALARGARVHAVSSYVADEIRETFALEPARVVVVPEGVPEVAAVEPGVGRALAGAHRYVLAVGTIEPRKDHATLVRAFAAVAEADRDLRLVLAGGDGWGSDAFEKTLAASPARSRVVRLGYVNEVQRAGLLRDAAVLAYPSLYEGFGLPPLEAMSVSVPVVATAAGALPEVLGNAAALVPVGDVDALGEALARVLDDDKARARLVAAGRERAARYSWTRCADGLAALYRVAVAGARS